MVDAGPREHGAAPETPTPTGVVGGLCGPGPDRSGEVLGGRYALVERLAFGAIGEVYRSFDRVAERYVAVKMLHPERGTEPETVARFFREAAVLAQISHPHVAAALDMGHTAEDVLFLVLELVEGVTLAEALARDGPFPPDRAVFVAEQLCAALEAIHGQGVLHRDLKPENILLTAQGGHQDFVKLIDFGIALWEAPSGQAAAKLTVEGMVQGTAEYMSPEQAAGGTLDARSDLYSLGVVLFELVTGELPFDAPERYAIMRQHLEAPVPRLRDRVPPGLSVDGVPRGLERVIRRLLAKHPDERYASATALAHALAGVWGGRGPRGWPLGRGRGGRVAAWWGARAPTARRAAVGLAGALVVVGGVLALRPAGGGLAGEGGGGDVGSVASTGERLGGGAGDAVAGRAGDALAGEAVAAAPRSAPVPVVEPEPNPGARGGAGSGRAWATLARGEELGAVRAAAAALDARPDLATDARLTDVVFRALLEGRGQVAEEARGLVARHMTRAWRGRLERVARDGTRAAVRRRAERALRDSGQWGALEPWSRAVIGLRAARSCEERARWIARLAEAPDPRALPALRGLASARTGCGPTGRADCVACLRPQLEALIARLAEAGR